MTNVNSNNNNDKNVYILGAGFSAELGLPLQNNFLMKAKELFCNDPNKYSHFKNVFDYQNKLCQSKKYLNVDLLNLEELFNLLEMDAFYSEGRKASNIKRDFERLIRDTLVELTPQPFVHNNHTGQFQPNKMYDTYRKFLNLFIDNRNNCLHNDSIISFNYDLVVEAAVAIHNAQNRARIMEEDQESFYIGLDPLFGKDNITVDSDNDCFKSEFRSSSGVVVRHEFSDYNSVAEESLNLIKLHGSINWKLVKNGKAFIVPPTWNKSDKDVRLLWNKAYKELQQAKRIIIIGYSFPETDIYVKSLLTLAINGNENLQNIFFLNPDSDKAGKASEDLIDSDFFQHCDYKPWEFNEFIVSGDGLRFILERLNRDIELKPRARGRRVINPGMGGDGSWMR